MAPPVEQESSIEYPLGSGLVSQVPSLGDALGVVGIKEHRPENNPVR